MNYTFLDDRYDGFSFLTVFAAEYIGLKILHFYLERVVIFTFKKLGSEIVYQESNTELIELRYLAGQIIDLDAELIFQRFLCIKLVLY